MAETGERGEALPIAGRRGESRPGDADLGWPGHVAGLGGPRPGGALGPYGFRRCPAVGVARSSSADARALAPDGGIRAIGCRSDGMPRPAAHRAINQRAVKALGASGGEVAEPPAIVTG